MKTLIFPRIILGAGFLAVTCGTGLAQSTVFSDNFTSTHDLKNGNETPGGTAPANYTGYNIASGKTGQGTLSNGSFEFQLSSTTSSGFWEAQAVFSSTPVALEAVGDYINMTIEFSDTGGGLFGSAGAGLYAGLFDDGGVSPLTTLASSGLTTGSSASGGTQNWTGYVGKLLGNGGNDSTFSRPAQTETTANNQDLVVGTFSTSSGFTTAGTSSGTTASTISLNSGSPYTLDLEIELSAVGTLSVTETLYNGTGTNGTDLGTVTGSYTGVTDTSFDGLAFAASAKTTSENPEMTVSDINITEDLQPIGGTTPTPKIFGISVSGSTLTFSATNGTANGQYTFLESTNPALALSSWTPVFTNTFDGNGDINLSTNIVNLTNALEFYSIEVPSP